MPEGEVVIKNSILDGLDIKVGSKNYSLYIGSQEGLLLLTHWEDGHGTRWDDGDSAVRILKRDGVWLEIPTYWRAKVNPHAKRSLVVSRSKEIGTSYFG